MTENSTTTQRERNIFYLEIEIQQAHNRLTHIHHRTATELETDLRKLAHLQQELTTLKGRSDG